MANRMPQRPGVRVSFSPRTTAGGSRVPQECADTESWHAVTATEPAGAGGGDHAVGARAEH